MICKTLAPVVVHIEDILRLVLLDELAHPHHELQVRIVGGCREDVGLEGVVLPNARLQVLRLGKYKEDIGAPVQPERLNLLVPLVRPAAVRKRSGSRTG